MRHRGVQPQVSGEAGSDDKKLHVIVGREATAVMDLSWSAWVGWSEVTDRGCEERASTLEAA